MAWQQAGAIVITVALALLADMLHNNPRFDRVNQRFDGVHCSIRDPGTGINARSTHVEARLAELREDLRDIRGLPQDALRTRSA